MRQNFYFHDKFAKEKKEALINMPITLSWYYCNNWLEAETIKCEIEGYGFEIHVLKINYDPIGVVDRFYQNFHTKYKHQSLRHLEKYKKCSFKVRNSKDL